MKLKVQVNGKDVEITGGHDELALFLESVEVEAQEPVLDRDTLGEFLQKEPETRHFIRIKDDVLLLSYNDDFSYFGSLDEIDYDTKDYEVLSEEAIQDLNFVVVTDNSNWSNNKVNDIGFVGNEVEHEEKGLHFVFTKRSENSCWTYGKEFRQATKKEIELFLDNVQNDEVQKGLPVFRNGDIIRYDGKIGIITYENGDGTYDIAVKNKNSYQTRNLLYIDSEDLEKVEI